MNKMMCPHCGLVYDADEAASKHEATNPDEPYLYSLVPKHDESPGVACPGSEQCPRNPESDLRTLWNGEPPPARRRLEG